MNNKTMGAPTMSFTFLILLELVCGIHLFAQVVAEFKGGGSINFDIYETMSFKPQNLSYQYIIVGGGTAGCALAATLSQHYKVLLLERGGSPYGNLSIERMEGWGDLMVDHYEPGNEPPNSPIQAFRSADGVPNRRARVLGGGSAMNVGLYTRASRETIAVAGWEPALVKESYEWVEEKIVYQPEVIGWHLAYQHGLLEAGVTPNNGRTFEHVVGTKISGSIFDKSGRRHSAADLLSYGDAKLLTLVTYANVHRVVFENPDPTTSPRAIGVEYLDSNGETHMIRLQSGACNEVILSAGALGSPQLLLLSGVGPCKELSGMGIRCVHNLPDVGAHMVDNPCNPIFILSPKPVETALISVVGITREGVLLEGGSGGNWSWQFPAMGEVSIVPPMQRTNARLQSIDAHFRNLSANVKMQINKGGFVLSKVYAPRSSGHLRLKTTNVSENPYVQFNYYNNTHDIQTCRKGIQYLHKLLNSSAMSSFKFDTVTPLVLALYPNLGIPVGHKFVGAQIPTDMKNVSATTQWCKDTVTTIWHYHGGCVLQKVVDSSYRVCGVRSLRVVDGSTFTSSPGSNPQATVMLLGRYVGVNILNSRMQNNCQRQRF